MMQPVGPLHIPLISRMRLSGAANNAPVLAAIGDQTHRQNASSVSVTASATDADDDEQSLSHTSLELGMGLVTEHNWRFNASLDFFDNDAGSMTGLTLSAAKNF